MGRIYTLFHAKSNVSRSRAPPGLQTLRIFAGTDDLLEFAGIVTLIVWQMAANRVG
jgi:hypothetical protein